MPGLSITAARLVLTPLTSEDAPQLFAYRSDPEVSRYQFFEPHSLDDARAFIANAAESGWCQLGIRIEGGSALAGDLGFRLSGGPAPQAEIGVTLAPQYQGRGLAAEAVGAVLGHLFEEAGVHRAFASIDPRNTASLALFARVGMRQVAHLQQSLWFKGEWADDVVFALLRSEWRVPVERMWAAFAAARPELAGPDDAFSAWHFCDNEADADELAALVLSGRKRATTSALASYELEGDPLPQVGDLSVIAYWDGRACCVIRTVAVDVVAFAAVGEDFAAAEGEGDKSLAYWRAAHVAAFGREFAGTGRTLDGDTLVVCERFELVFPVV
jgi:uncharacterized protein YhfF/RimJ/RimL family protein N-acetyltransferase